MSSVIDPETLASDVEALRMRAVFAEGDEADVVLSPIAEQHYIAALAALESARCSLKLAHYHRMRGE